MDAIAITAITNFMLACEVFFLAGWLARGPSSGALQRGSAAFWWALGLTLLGLSALLGGIDHGFVQARGLDRYLITHLNWMVLGGMTACVLLAAAQQFFTGRTRRVLVAVALLQWAAYSSVLWQTDRFVVVIVNYLPVMLLWLGLNVLHLRQGSPGASPAMVAGVVLLLAASAGQALKVRWPGAELLDHNGLYHLIVMVAVVPMALGGRGLRASCGPV
ncbi:DUF6962 family protein [Amphibiibacter pelophylacis]|uniref:Uncharacterized protein n=1 Tax=Amphibiibacter pelophylacis TaxID=1799477 RepID=A0ACC6P0L8_9BURK